MSTVAAVERAVAAIAAGEMVIVVDSADRENEGDLVMAAQHVSARHVHFMATEGRGLICVPMTAARLAALRIDPMVAHNTDPAGTAFHVSVDVRAGTTTGISASDRASTIRALANPDSRAEDFSRPGHLFPLAARDGGVLERGGHTEAAIDLVTLAGLEPVAVICEIADSDGEMARMPTLIDFAQRHRITMVSIAELAAYRRRTERLIDRVGQARLPLPQGEFTAVGYRDTTNGAEHIALVHGDVTASDHVGCTSIPNACPATYSDPVDATAAPDCTAPWTSSSTTEPASSSTYATTRAATASDARLPASDSTTSRPRFWPTSASPPAQQRYSAT